MYLARVLGADLYGTIAFSAAVLLYLSRVADGGMDLGLGVRQIAAEPAETLSSLPSILVTRIAIAIALAAALAGVAYLALPRPDAAVLAAYGLTLLPVAASSRWVHLGFDNARSVAFARATGELVVVLLILGLVRGRADLLVAPFAQFTGDAAAATLLLALAMRRGWISRAELNFAALRPLATRAWPLVASGLLSVLIYNSDLIFLRFLRGREEVGLYAAAYTLASFLLNMGTAYSLSLLPALTRTAATPERHHDLYHTAAAHVFAVGFPVAVGTALLAPKIIALVFGAEFVRSATALTILIWALPLALLRDIPVTALLAWGREALVFRLTAWSAGVNVILNLILIPSYGLIGAAMAAVLTEAGRMLIAQASVRFLGFTLTRPVRFWKAFTAGSIMGGILVLASPSSIWFGLVLGALVYTVALASLGGISAKRGAFPSLRV